MAILSFSTAPAKDDSATVTLNKSELYALSPVSGDAFWSIASNISQVSVAYESTIGGQNKALNFDAQTATPTDGISFSAFARDMFEIKHIILRDFDSGELMLSRATLSGLITISALDIDLT